MKQEDARVEGTANTSALAPAAWVNHMLESTFFSPCSCHKQLKKNEVGKGRRRGEGRTALRFACISVLRQPTAETPSCHIPAAGAPDR